jgi:hypothetical protein
MGIQSLHGKILELAWDKSPMSDLQLKAGVNIFIKDAYDRSDASGVDRYHTILQPTL